MNSGLYKLAIELFFSDWLGEEERDIVRAGYEEYKDFFLKNKGEAEFQKEKGNIRLYRLLGDTDNYLRYSGDPKYLSQLEGFEKMWREMGYKAIADGFKVRVAEAMYDDTEEPELPDIDVEWDEPESTEPAPETLHSLVAEIIRFTNSFYKVARG